MNSDVLEKGERCVVRLTGIGNQATCKLGIN